MGPVNWIAVALAALVACLIGGLWYGPLFGRSGMSGAGRQARVAPLRTLAPTLVCALIAATLLGHMFARLSDPSKWWLYPMMSGGVALGFVTPALWASYARRNLSRRAAAIDAGYWIAAYLAMGAVFFALGQV